MHEQTRVHVTLRQFFQAFVGSLPYGLTVLALLFGVVAWYVADAGFARRAELRTLAPGRARAYLGALGFAVMGDIVCRGGDVRDATYCDASSGSTVVTIRCTETCYLVTPPQE